MENIRTQNIHAHVAVLIHRVWNWLCFGIHDKKLQNILDIRTGTRKQHKTFTQHQKDISKIDKQHIHAHAHTRTRAPTHTHARTRTPGMLLIHRMWNWLCFGIHDKKIKTNRIRSWQKKTYGSTHKKNTQMELVSNIKHSIQHQKDISKTDK